MADICQKVVSENKVEVKKVDLSEADVKINEDFIRNARESGLSFAVPGWDGWD